VTGPNASITEAHHSMNNSLNAMGGEIVKRWSAYESILSSAYAARLAADLRLRGNVSGATGACVQR
jgi:hypothetical protein